MKKFKWPLIIISLSGGFFLLLIMLPTEIIDVHQTEFQDSEYIIVRNLPLTDMGKIQWWERNKIRLQQQYNLPIEKEKYRISFFRGKYKINTGTDQDSNLLCFKDMKSKANCIEKGNQPLTVLRIQGRNETIFLLNNWREEYIKDDKTASIRKVD